MTSKAHTLTESLARPMRVRLGAAAVFAHWDDEGCHGGRAVGSSSRICVGTTANGDLGVTRMRAGKAWWLENTPKYRMLARRRYEPDRVTVERGAPLADAWALMVQHDARHLPVVDGVRLVGILSARDIELHESLSRDRSGGAAAPVVAEAMTDSVFTRGPDARLHAVAHEMAEHKLGSAVVVDREPRARGLRHDWRPVRARAVHRARLSHRGATTEPPVPLWP